MRGCDIRIGNNIGSRAAVDDIVSGKPLQTVIARAAQERIRARPAEERVIAVKAGKRHGAGPVREIEPVIARGAKKAL